MKLATGLSESPRSRRPRRLLVIQAIEGLERREVLSTAHPGAGLAHAALSPSFSEHAVVNSAHVAVSASKAVHAAAGHHTASATHPAEHGTHAGQGHTASTGVSGRKMVRAASIAPASPVSVDVVNDAGDPPPADDGSTDDYFDQEDYANQPDPAPAPVAPDPADPTPPKYTTPVKPPAGGVIDPTVTPIFRGGNGGPGDFTPGKSDYKTDPDGNIKLGTTSGVSLNTNPDDQYVTTTKPVVRNPQQIVSIPPDLEIVQQGRDTHAIIRPKVKMTPQKFADELAKIKTVPLVK